ncbi:MAG TPA: LptA/OstA family protein [Acidobacteriaceae bacterium]
MPPPSVRHLRRSVAAGGVLLLAVLGVFLGLARLRGHLFHLDLPGRLGVNISQTANGFTYSQSEKGHTLFTIHASKLVQYKAEQAELHDVTITLYGPEGSGRTDKIYGSDFLYDRNQGTVRANGTVQIDFAAPATRPPGTGAAPGKAAAPSPPQNNTVHVTTSGLVFNQGTGEATCDQRVDFTLPRASGSAVGADYNAKSGLLILGRDVTLTTIEAGPGSQAGAVVHAAHAQLLRETHQAYLIKADSAYGGRRTTSDQAVVTFRGDGSAETVDARGHVHVTTETGAELRSSTAMMELDAQSQPASVHLDGGVTYHSEDQGQTMQGSAVQGTLTFAAATAHPPGHGDAAPQAQLHHARFRDAVSFVLQQHSFAGDPNGSSTREMRATQLDVDFAPGPSGKAEAQRALGVGGAMVNLHDIPAKMPAKNTSIRADQLLATLANGREIKLLDGQGHTQVVETAPDGATSTSAGDTLHTTFASAAARNSGAESGAAQVDTAIQQGNVVITQVPANSGGAASPLHATAARAEYHAADQIVHLTGDPHLRNDTLALTADRVDYHRDTGDATAVGQVKSTYVQQGGQKAPTLGGDGPVHVVADHAQMTRSSNLSVFYGTQGTLARMWQGGDAVAAPVLELGREQQTLDAHGAPGDRGPVVHATLGARAAASPAATASAGGATAPAGHPTQKPGEARLTSQTLHYADKDRRADLHGTVTAEQPSGVVHADEAQIYLTPERNKPSELDHLVASSHVVILQPGRRGTGDRLVYTAADQRYLLTGTPGQPPRVVDAEKGTTTGAALLFRGADDSVEVSSQLSPGAGSAASNQHGRTVTDTHTPK